MKKASEVVGNEEGGTGGTERGKVRKGVRREIK